MTKTVPISVPSEYSHVELCAIDVLLDNTKLRLFVCYRPLSSNNDIDAIRYVKDLCDCIDCILIIFPSLNVVILIFPILTGLQVAHRFLM
jgi:hypothetical protein